MNWDMKSLRSRFVTMFGASPTGAVRAPGRVNLIGEHTDYNGGFVLPIAIEREVRALFRPRDDRTVNMVSGQSPNERAKVDLDLTISPGLPKWANYCKGVIAGLIEEGVALGGADVYFEGNVPLGGGLSSSAALEVATGMAMLSAAGMSGSVPGPTLARICQKAENEYAGAPCGIMDQAISAMGQAGHAMLMDCRDGSLKQIPFDNPDLVVLVADTQVKHSIADGGYAARREQCFSAARKMNVASLRDADEASIELSHGNGLIDDVEFMRARHVVGEILRTLEACASLQSGDYRQFGRLMYASHYSLRDDYQVSCEELDELVRIASVTKGVYGARMTGGGFGGCAIALVDAELADSIAQALAEGFFGKFGRRCPVFATRATAGAGMLE